MPPSARGVGISCCGSARLVLLICYGSFGTVVALRVSFCATCSVNTVNTDVLLFEEMSSSSSSSLRTGSAELPLIQCKFCNAVVVERVSKQPESMSRKFYPCIAKKAVYFSSFAQLISYMDCRILRAQGFLLYRMGLSVIFSTGKRAMLFC